MVDKYLAKHNPEWKLIYDNPPPVATKLLFRGLYTGAVISVYNPDYGFVAWMELPKYSEETKERLAELLAAGVDLTRPANSGS